ncbi:uncharacterized protein LOC129593056 [Paramacrobiotus metropolitanus]|uniref:uncharacterized protein LOC129593056 n=1 Tax=Paramacrobiotus metropolitanus TaxID=2943436 RepID=UPI002445EE3F|nr:uncharacterized protein LOC129593056 [Paramacrobiotus metropolitanus]
MENAWIPLFSVLCFVSWKATIANVTTPIPVPHFSAEPITRDQCAVQYTKNCRPIYVKGFVNIVAYPIYNYEDNPEQEIFRQVNCTFTNGVQLHCNDGVTSHEIRQLAESLSQPPMRAVLVNLTDGPLVTFDNLSPVRAQTIILNLYNCTSARTTGKLPTLGFSNLLSFELHNCYDTVVQKADFGLSIKLRMIIFANTTLRTLEKDTFRDLPALRLISLENGFSETEVFSKDIIDYLRKLHCGSEYEWYRQWWSGSNLLRSANKKEIFNIPGNSWHNEQLTADKVFLPIDCAVSPFPNGSGSIDFEQNAFPINKTSYERVSSNCRRDEVAEDTSPVFCTEPLTQAECDFVQLDLQCPSLRIMPDYVYCPHPERTGNFLDPPYCLRDLHRLSGILAQLPPRALAMTWMDNLTIESADLGQVRPYILTFDISWCHLTRATNLLNRLRLVNVLGFGLIDCTNLDIKKIDFHNSRKLREFRLSNCTIRTLEVDAFADLPSLAMLSVEDYFRTGPEVHGHTWTWQCTINASVTTCSGFIVAVSLPGFGAGERITRHW